MTAAILATVAIYAAMAIVPSIGIVFFSDWLARREHGEAWADHYIPECADVAETVRAIDDAMLAALDGREVEET